MKQQIRGLEESIRKLTRLFEKSVAPSFPSCETINRISMYNTSKTNRDSQPQPLHGMTMNSYLGQIPPLASLLDRSVPLDMVVSSKFLLGQFDPYTNHLTFLDGQSGATLGPPRGTPIVANIIGQSRYAYAEPTISNYPPSYLTPQQ
jgi:murein DD-endopeptidase MepM/ murein hydrolase activator NlpD